MQVFTAKVYGKVQGVWFRKYIKQIALEYNLVGMAKNLDDGTVLIYVSGESKNIRRFNDKMYIGSPGSKVDIIHFSKESLLSKYTSFEIEY